MISTSEKTGGWGVRFKTAREAIRLTEKEAATRLHLKSSIITIIETESFQDGPPAIFMRGYVRSYGRLLNLSEKEMNQALDQFNLMMPTTTVGSPLLHRQPMYNNHNPIRWGTPFIILVLAGLVGVWWNTHANAPTTTVTPIASVSPPATVAPSQPLPTATPPAETPLAAATTPPAIPSTPVLPVSTPVEPTPLVEAHQKPQEPHLQLALPETEIAEPGDND